MAEILIDLQHVYVSRESTPVLHDINLRVSRGEHLVILGPNGCGKSTLIKTMTCELYPIARPETKVTILGGERWDLAELRKHLGVVGAEIPGRSTLGISGREAVLTGFFSSSSLWPNLEVTPEMKDRCETVLEVTATRDFASRKFGELSAGQQRRILIARALVASRDCLLLDEPSNALDLAAQRCLRELLINLAERGVTILLITHHIADIIPHMRRVVMMKSGHIVADGPRSDLLCEEKLSQLFSTRVNLAERDGFYNSW